MEYRDDNSFDMEDLEKMAKEKERLEQERIEMLQLHFNAPVANITLLDTELITGTSFTDHCIQRSDGKYYINVYSDTPIDPNLLTKGGADFYVIRVVGDNGRYCYVGPIWVEY
jgi:hypothetical protein